MKKLNLKNISGLSLIATAMLALSAGSAHATSYSLTLLDSLGSYSEATGVNHSNQVSGNAYTGSAFSAVIWNGATPTRLDALGGTSSYAMGINDAGQAVGFAQNEWDSYAAATWTAGSTTATALGGTYNQANAINKSGQIGGGMDGQATIWQTGSARQLGNGSVNALNDVNQAAGTTSNTTTWQNQATRWDGDVTTVLDSLPGGGFSVAAGINNLGQVVGVGSLANGEIHAMTWSDTSAIDLGTLGGSFSVASGINDAGQIVGTALTTDDQSEVATLWQGTSATDLNSFLSASDAAAGWYLYTATAINDIGSIVGSAYNLKSGQERAFLLTANADVAGADTAIAAVPEPQTYALLLGGLGALGFVARRRKG